MFAFLGLVLMNMAQPALLYLCPAHLIATYLVALSKKQVKDLWSGKSVCNAAIKKTLIVFISSSYNYYHCVFGFY
jgi:hypothetical protein